MKARDLAFAALLKDGCSPEALDALKDSEASDAVWLLAAQLAEDWHGAEWEWFVQPGNIPGGECYFVGRYTSAIPDAAERIERDTKVLRGWLAYAAARIKKTERRLLVHQLARGRSDPGLRRLVRDKAGA